MPVEASDPSLLALVTDDPLAPRLLAWWKAKGPDLLQAPALMPEIARIVGADDLSAARATFDRCELARLVVNGGISETASRWLGVLLSQQLGRPSAPKKTPPKPTPRRRGRR